MREVSHGLSATADDARKSLEEFRKQLLETVDLTTGPWARNPEKPWPDSTVTTMHVYELPRDRATRSASPENFRGWCIDSSAKRLGLKCRCDQLQILSRGLTLAGSRQDLLHEPTSVLVAVRVKQRGFIGLNTLQGTSHRVLLLSGRLYCDRTETDDGHSNQHCRDEACSDRNLVLHKVARIRGIRTTVNNKKQKSYRGTLGRAGQVDGTPEKSIRFSPT